MRSLSNRAGWIIINVHNNLKSWLHNSSHQAIRVKQFPEKAIANYILTLGTNTTKKGLFYQRNLPTVNVIVTKNWRDTTGNMYIVGFSLFQQKMEGNGVPKIDDILPTDFPVGKISYRRIVVNVPSVISHIFFLKKRVNSFLVPQIIQILPSSNPPSYCHVPRIRARDTQISLRNLKDTGP